MNSRAEYSRQHQQKHIRKFNVFQNGNIKVFKIFKDINIIDVWENSLQDRTRVGGIPRCQESK